MKWLRSVSYPLVAGKLNLSVMSVAFVIFGLSLIFQPHRWASTPAYHVLLQIFRAQTWGALFLASGVGMALAVWQFGKRWAVIASLMLAFTLTIGWMLAFIARYLTSPDTTPETWVSWAVFAFLLLNVASSLDRPAESPAAAVPPAGAMPPGDLAEEAINEARNALLRAEEAYARATGRPARQDPP